MAAQELGLDTLEEPFYRGFFLFYFLFYSILYFIFYLFSSLFLIGYGELDDVHITLKTSIMAAQELGLDLFEEPFYPDFFILDSIFYFIFYLFYFSH